MTLPEFLKEVDGLSHGYTREELVAFIHEVARTLPETKRSHFIHTMQIFGNSSAQTLPLKMMRDDGRVELMEAIETVIEKLIEINKGDRCLDSEYNEEWDDWYNSDANQVFFTDPQGILKDIDKATELIHSCVDREEYQAGCKLAEIVSVLEVMTEGDYDDYYASPLRMLDLSDYRLLEGDFKRLVRECLYLTYMGNAIEERADELFCMMGNFAYYEIRLEDIMQSGNNDLPEFDEFLRLWIAYLGKQRGSKAEGLLEEAQMMLQDDEMMLENAREFAAVHPSLYVQLLQMKLVSGEDLKMLRIGQEALDKVSSSLTIRSEIALLTAEYACKLSDSSEAEKCWLEAFRSNPTVVNYLRIRCCAADWSRYEAEVALIYQQIYRQSKEAGYNRYYESGPQEKVGLDKNDYCFLLFFDGQFDSLYTVGMSEKKALGWSSTFMKEGLALMLLLLYKDQGAELPPGLQEMLRNTVSACGFTSQEFYRGTVHSQAEDDNDNKSDNKIDFSVFGDLFKQWKNRVLLSEDEIKTWHNRINKWIALRISGIMENNRRNYYGECAAFIAAFGETGNSLGFFSSKYDIMEQYRNGYARRSSFVKELRNYGLRK